MQLTNQVVLPAPPERVFELISDVERVAPCMPGATLEGRSGQDTYQGRVKVKVGPISAAYTGTVRFLEVDEQGHRIVLDAKGTDQHGSGNAEAKVDVRIGPHDDGSVLVLDTDLVVRGKVAQFGRGALADVSQRLMEQFARNLNGVLTGTASGDAESKAPATAPPSEESPAQAEVDGLALLAPTLAKRALPVAVALVVGVVVGRKLGRGPRSRGVLADEVTDAVVHVGSERHAVPVRRVTWLLGHR